MINLQTVESAEVTILVDNVMDVLLPSSEVVKRAALNEASLGAAQLRAEHGFALLLTVEQAGQKATLLYDAGLGQTTLVHNMAVLGLPPSAFQAIVLSHGHTDHHGGLAHLVKQLEVAQPIPLLIHPAAWRNRKMVAPTGAELSLPAPKLADLDPTKISIMERCEPTLLFNETVLVTGEVGHETAFERGPTNHLAQGEDGHWEADSTIWDDQALVIHVRDKGLIILTGCSHAGIVNIIRYAQRLTGTEKIYGIIGGFHLIGPNALQVIPLTVAELERFNPEIIVPGHCTGWQATHEIARRLPAAFVQSSVGTTLRFAA